MDATINVALGMVHNIMHEVIANLVVAYRVVRIDFGTVLDVLEKNILKSLAGDVRNNLCAYLPKISVKDSLHNSLSTMHPTLLHKSQFAILVHVLSESADERFIGFQFRVRSAQFGCRTKRAIVQGSSEPLKHEPCRLLGNAQSAVNLHAGNAVLAIDQHPKARHPLVETDRRIFKDRIDLERKLLVAATAEPDAPRLDEVVLFRTATRAMNLAIRPAQANGVVESSLRIGEINDGLL